MKLRNLRTCAEISSENPIEAKALLEASMSSYSPRSAGILQNEDRMLVLTTNEAEEFASGVLHDVRLNKSDKWAIAKLIAVWMSGEIKPHDEAFANA